MRERKFSFGGPVQADCNRQRRRIHHGGPTDHHRRRRYRRPGRGPCPQPPGSPGQGLEQASEFAEIGAGIQIGPNIFKMFEVLGLTDAISDLAVFPDHLIMRDTLTGHGITSVPVGSAAFRAR